MHNKCALCYLSPYLTTLLYLPRQRRLAPSMSIAGNPVPGQQVSGFPFSHSSRWVAVLSQCSCVTFSSLPTLSLFCFTSRVMCGRRGDMSGGSGCPEAGTASSHIHLPTAQNINWVWGLLCKSSEWGVGIDDLRVSYLPGLLGERVDPDSGLCRIRISIENKKKLLLMC